MAAFHYYSQQEAVVVLSAMMERWRDAVGISGVRGINEGKYCLQLMCLQRSLQLRMRYLLADLKFDGHFGLYFGWPLWYFGLDFGWLLWYFG